MFPDCNLIVFLRVYIVEDIVVDDEDINIVMTVCDIIITIPCYIMNNMNNMNSMNSTMCL